MRNLAALGLLAAGFVLAAGAFAAPVAKGVKVVADEAQRRVDITIDGQPFTSYIWPTNLKKPVLYPILDSDGVTLTRGFPPRPGERVDHPHHVGLWFNYARVNNFDFWNNSEAIKPENRGRWGLCSRQAALHQERTEARRVDCSFRPHGGGECLFGGAPGGGPFAAERAGVHLWCWMVRRNEEPRGSPWLRCSSTTRSASMAQLRFEVHRALAGAQARR